MIALRV